jgi:hypothetical protein
MNYSRILLGALAATVAYFAIGGLSFALMPQLADEFRKYPAVYRNQEGMKSVMPIGLVAMFVGLFVLGVLYALMYRAGSGVAEGARFGALIGIFAVCVFVLHNYVNLNIGLKLTLQQATVYFIEWTVVGILIGVIYRPKGAI